jgi:hypothetical protein
MAVAIVPVSRENSLDSVNPTLIANNTAVGCYLVSGTKSHNWRCVHYYDISAYANWVLTAVEMHVDNILNPAPSAYACMCRRALQDWVQAQASWNERATGTAWLDPGADRPDSSTDTGEVAFNAPTGYSWVLTGLLALAQDAIALRGGILMLHYQPVVEAPGVTNLFTRTSPVPYLVLTGNPPFRGQVI